MKKNLLDLSKKIDDEIVEVFDAIESVAKTLRAPFFVVGAFARDAILQYGYGINTIRATRDIDLAIIVSNWEEYNVLKQSLLKTGKFKKGNNNPGRIVYKDTFPIDIVPFGKVEDKMGFICWPPENNFRINALGFKESFNHSILVRMRSDTPLDIRFASLTGQAILKLISWNDDYPNRAKDAQDLLLIMLNYIDAGNQDRYYEDIELLEMDYELASARLLGRDIAKIFTAKLYTEILKILKEETIEEGRNRLIIDMIEGNFSFYNDFEKLCP